MANNYKRYFRHNHYTFQELIGQITAVKAQYTDVSFRTKKRGIEGFISLQPTEESLIYKLKISAQIDSTIVNIFPIEPHIGREVNGQAIPHMYPDGSLCLYYPDYKEWKYSDLWADTLIPWTSLWLYYYELWLQTGEWLGGGIHSRKEKSDVTQ